MGEITIVGLGPGAFELITLQTLTALEGASKALLRTAKHPSVAELTRRGIAFTSYDYVYEEKNTFEEVYETIAQDCLLQAVSQHVVYAVPGSPLVAEKTVTLIRQHAVSQGIKVNILPGMSFLEVLYTRLGVDPIDGVTVLDAGDVADLPVGLHTSLVITQVYNRQVASDAKLSLMERYPDDFEIVVVRNLGLDSEEIQRIPLYELDRMDEIDHLTSVYVPQVTANSTRFSMQPLVDVMARLRSPNGCMWDIEQSHKSLRRYMVEEVYEVLEAIDLEEADKLCEELGDLLLQIVFHARIAEESNQFAMQDVVDTVTEKMIRRHPHVFGDITVQSAAEVVLNWEDIKKQEKGHERKSVLDGIPPALPSLMKAYKLQSKAAKVGFDWEDIQPVWEKVQEELAELRQVIDSKDTCKIEDELGDVLFTIVNVARFLEVDAEQALRGTNNKFIRRFQYIENHVNKNGGNWKKFSLEELDKLWNEAKKDKI